MEASRVVASSRVDDLALELLQARSYIHSTLTTDYGKKGDEPSEPQQAFHPFKLSWPRERRP